MKNWMSGLRIQEIVASLIIFFISFVFVFSAITTHGIWKTFDSPFHITMIAQFHRALSYGQFPIVWTDGVANYGLPFGIIAHPLTSYLGGIITFWTHDPLTSYKVLWLLFSILNSWGMYRLLRRFTGIGPALAGSALYTFTAYHILNLYIRGALPEFAAAAWLPFLLNSLFIEKDIDNWKHSFITFTFWYTLIFFTHPMYILFSALITGLFLIFYRPSKTFWYIVVASSLFALLINAFYLLPLNLEMKYFYMGRESNFLAKGSGLNLSQFFLEQWEYTCSNGDSPAYRCNHIQTGLPEILLLIAAPVLWYITKNKSRKKVLLFISFSGLITTILLLNILQPLYSHIRLLGSIQFIFRFLNIWTLLPPIVLAVLLETLPKYKNLIISIVIGLIVILRVPQLYVKNVTNPNRSIYYFDVDNVHSVMMNTIWMGEPKTYKRQSLKGAILSGKGKITSQQFTPTKHIFTVNAQTKLLMADYTFYFPGWHIYVDGAEVPVQWQDPTHRGYMTFTVSEGNHQMLALFKDSKVRLIGKILSIVGLAAYVLCVVLFQKKYAKKIVKK